MSEEKSSPRFEVGVCHDILNFWSLSEKHVREISKLPIEWYLGCCKQSIEDMQTGDLKKLSDVALRLSIYAQDLHVRVMDDLTKDAPGRHLKSAISGNGTS